MLQWVIFLVMLDSVQNSLLSGGCEFGKCLCSVCMMKQKVSLLLVFFMGWQMFERNGEKFFRLLLWVKIQCWFYSLCMKGWQFFSCIVFCVVLWMCEMMFLDLIGQCLISFVIGEVLVDWLLMNRWQVLFLKKVMLKLLVWWLVMLLCVVNLVNENVILVGLVQFMFSSWYMVGEKLDVIKQLLFCWLLGVLSVFVFMVLCLVVGCCVYVVIYLYLIVLIGSYFYEV